MMLTSAPVPTRKRKWLVWSVIKHRRLGGRMERWSPTALSLPIFLPGAGISALSGLISEAPAESPMSCCILFGAGRVSGPQAPQK